MIRSRVHTLLYEEMLQHLQGAAGGRSFLIAGHRGAGKTTLVQSVVEQVRREVLNAPPQGQVAKVRPLLIKLHGPSLLCGDHKPASSDQSKTPTPDPLVQVVVNGTKADARPDDAEAEAARPEPAGAALAQIMVALYRALASEVSEAFLLATDGGDSDSSDNAAAELASGLRLALDSGGDPAMLRECWARLDFWRRPYPLSTKLFYGEDRGVPRSTYRRGYLETGVLWRFAPVTASEGRGYREIVALATAAQSFQVCIGTVTSSETRSGTTARDAKIEVSSKAALKDVSNKLFALAAGFGVGYGVNAASKPVVAAAAGLATALATSLTLDWSASRSSRTETNSNYTFLPDRTLLSLDRDLPLVLDRIRAIGLAPIFLVDELDKVEKPDEPLSMLIDRLKQLTADHAFFCFLTDRDYLDRVEAKFKTDVYPKEHTYFAHRLLVAPRPADYAAYLRDAIAAVGTTPSSASSPPPEQVSALILGRWLMHRSFLNTVDLQRELASVTGTGQSITLDEAELRSLEIYRLETMLQLAIEFAMRQQSIVARTRNNERFVQIAADALYMISRDWKAGKQSVTITAKAVKAHLAGRMDIPPDELPQRLNDGDLAAFESALLRIADIMCDFEQLARLLKDDAGFAEADRPLLEIFKLALKPALLKKKGDDEYEFLWDAHGLLLGSAVSAEDATLGFIRSFVDLCTGLGLSLDLLGASGLLPSTISDLATRQSISRLEIGTDYPERQSDIVRLKTVYDLVVARGPVLKLILSLVRHVETWAECTASVALQAIRRYNYFEELAPLSGIALSNRIEQELGGIGALSSLPDLSPDPTPEIEEWTAQILETSIPVHEPSTEGAAWAAWQPRVDAYVENADRKIARASLNDVVLAAKGLLPGRLFQRDFSLLGIMEWSELVLEGVRSDGALGWAVPAGLFKLGFGRALLIRLSRAFRGPGMTADEVENARAQAAKLATIAREEGPGVLDLVSRPESENRQRGPGDLPVLRLRVSMVPDYYEALEWLQQRNAFSIVIYDGDEDDGGSAAA